MTTAGRDVRERQVWDALAGIPDPEIPAISVVDLGGHARTSGTLGTVRTPPFPVPPGPFGLGGFFV